MTRRGFWFISAAAGAVLVALISPNQFTLAMFGLTGLIWCAWEWCLFRWRVDWTSRQLVLKRSVNGRPAHRTVLWENRPAKVELSIESAGVIGLPWVRAVDLRPTGAETRGAWAAEGRCDRTGGLQIQYELLPKLPGSMAFDGVLLEWTDGPGFFRARVILRDRQVASVLPALTPDRGLASLRKRDNRVPAQGVHRHLQPGSGSDLLNLRDYIAGDSPKRIAWKISARRDRLITKEYESEVPIRTWLFVDASDSVRVGWPGPTPLDQSVGIASALVRELIAIRDPVGLCIVDTHGPEIIPAAPGSRQETRLLAELCRVAGRPPSPSPCPPRQLFEPAEYLCRTRYADLLDPRVNPRRLRVEWPWSRLLGWPLGIFLAVAAIGFAFAAGALRVRSESVAEVLAARIPPFDANVSTTVIVTLLASLVVWGVLHYRRWRRRVPRASGAALRRRKQISSVVAVVEHLGPAGLARCIEDDAEFSRRTQQFLMEHRIPYPRPLHDARGEYLFRSPAKIEHAARALLRQVMHGRDNEVFVLLVDLLEHEDHWFPLVDAMKVAKARHHQVILVCPWPAELLPPTLKERQSQDRTLPLSIEATETHVERLLAERYYRAYESLSRHLGTVGIALLVASIRDTPREVLRRIEMVRSARIPAYR